ncbi:MAG: beta-ketoacyl-ACP synthase III [Acidimicrobiia bacterium]
MRYAEITGWGKCLPPVVLTNSDLEKIVDTSDDWITTRSGIKERRISHVETSDLAMVAGHRALAAAGRRPEDVDLIILATCSADTVIPSGASFVQRKLGAAGAGAFDLNAACSGWLYGLVVGSDMVKGGVHDRVLVIGAEKLSFFMNFSDRSTAVLFGDGAGAALIEPSEERVGVMASELGSDGEAAEYLWIEGRGTTGSVRHEDPSKQGITMDGREVFRRAVATMGDASVRVVTEAGWSLEDVDMLIPHQANVRIIDATTRRLKLDPAKAFVNIGSYGNTSAATIPIALTEALEQGQISPGSNLVFAAFGAGLSWAAVAYRWGRRTEPIEESDTELPSTSRDAWDLLQPNFDFYGRRRAGEEE